MAILTKLIEVSIKSLIVAAADYDCTILEITTRGRGNCIDVMLVDDEDMTLAELRVYERTVMILNPLKYGFPKSCVSTNSSERWTAHHASPADFRREMDALVSFYIYRREGQEA